MAIDTSYLKILKQTVDLLSTEKPRLELQALCLAYPDLVVPTAVLREFFGEELLEKLPARPDAGDIWAWHGLSGVKDQIFDTLKFLERLGFRADVIDIAAIRGDERIVDLNHPLPIDLVRRYDLVLDTGTCEHCFNVGQAFLNACEAVAQGGYLVHAAPTTKSNHGFWNFCPTVYPDFLEDNGFEMLFFSGVKGGLKEGLKFFPIEPFSRKALPVEAAIYVVAKRIKIESPKWPVQRKYRKI